MSSLERVALLDNLIDRVRQLEQRYAELASSAIMLHDHADATGYGMFSGWVVTGTALRDPGHRMVLDANVPELVLAPGGVIRSTDYTANTSGFKIDGGTAEFNTIVMREVRYTEHLRPVRSGTAYTGYAVVPLTTALVHSGLNGATISPGVYSIGPLNSGATYTYDYPAAARGLFVRLTAQWSDVNNVNVVLVRPYGRTNQDAGAIVRSQVANIRLDTVGFVALDSSGRAELVVNNASAIIILSVIGYVL